MHRLPFDKLRVNGADIEIIRIYSFVVRLLNHKKYIFNCLLIQHSTLLTVFYQDF